MKRILVIATILIVLAGAAWIYFRSTFKEPVFMTMKDIRVLRFEGQTGEVSAIAVFNNPNTYGAVLLNTELKVYSNDILLGQVSQTQLTDIKALSDFEIPLKFTVDLLKLGMSQGISGMVENLMNEERIIPVKFEGYCRIRSKDRIYRIPVTYDDKLIFK